MPTVTKADPTALRFPIPVPILVVALFAIAGATVYWIIGARQPAPKGPVLTPETKAYVKYLPLGDVEMKARESYSKQTLVEITGKISNTGDRSLKLVEVNCIFYDPYGQLVLRDRVPIVREKTGGLRPGQTKDFRLAFDTIPESWNQAMPQVVIAQIIFE